MYLTVTVSAWAVKAKRAWVERQGGEVVRLYAEEAMTAEGHQVELKGDWISVERGGLPVVAEVRRMESGEVAHQAAGRVARFEYRGPNEYRFLGKTRSRTLMGR